MNREVAGWQLEEKWLLSLSTVWRGVYMGGAERYRGAEQGGTEGWGRRVGQRGTEGWGRGLQRGGAGGTEGWGRGVQRRGAGGTEG